MKTEKAKRCACACACAFIYNIIFALQRHTQKDAQTNKLQELKMAAMAALQSCFTSLSLTSNSFLGHRLFPSPPTIQIRTADQRPCLIVMKLKHWERKDCKPNSLPMLHKMHVKVGDTVKVISGSEKGKIGEVTEIFKHNSTVIVKDINLKTKHVKPKRDDEQGQIIKIEGPIHSSNVMLYSKEKEVTSRVGHKIVEDGSKVRYLIKTGEIIDSPEKWKEVMKNKKGAEKALTTTS